MVAGGSQQRETYRLAVRANPSRQRLKLILRAAKSAFQICQHIRFLRTANFHYSRFAPDHLEIQSLPITANRIAGRRRQRSGRLPDSLRAIEEAFDVFLHLAAMSLEFNRNLV